MVSESERCVCDSAHKTFVLLIKHFSPSGRQLFFVFWIDFCFVLFAIDFCFACACSKHVFGDVDWKLNAPKKTAERCVRVYTAKM